MSMHRAWMVAWIVAVIVCPAASRAQIARPAACSDPSGQSVRLLPKDDAARQPSFAEFRRQLRDVAARRDEATLLGILHPDVKASFGGDTGIAAFKALYLDADADAFWTEFQTVLALGGSSDQAGTFAAPYVYATWPDDLDAFDCVAVVGRRVRMRARPSTAAPVVTVLDYHIVELLQSERGRDAEGWRHVRTSDGKTGYIAARYVRSSVDHRALFARSEGRWWLTAYVAGD